jgi:lysozyme family protein
MTFNTAIKLIIDNEGGYVWDKDDPGGETNFGISKRAYPNLDIKNLTQEEAEAIYFNDYWLKMRLDGFNNSLLQLHLFDEGVNSGIGTASILLQQILGVVSDGIIGVITIYTANSYSDQKELTDNYIAARKSYYNAIVKKTPSEIKYLEGWIQRVNDTTNFFNQNINII